MNWNRCWSRVCCAGLVIGLAGPLAAQPAPGAATPLLLRRLASFVDDHRTGESFFVVAELAPPHHIYPTPARTRAEADSLATKFGGRYGVFGPFLTPRDEVAPARRITWTRMLLLGLEGADTIRLEVDPRLIDAIVFSTSAYDRYFHPYNRSMWGDSLAVLMRRGVMGARLGCHMKIIMWSVTCRDSVGTPEGIRPILLPGVRPPWIPASMTTPPP